MYAVWKLAILNWNFRFFSSSSFIGQTCQIFFNEVTCCLGDWSQEIIFFSKECLSFSFFLRFVWSLITIITSCRLLVVKRLTCWFLTTCRQENGIMIWLAIIFFMFMSSCATHWIYFHHDFVGKVEADKLAG